MQKSALDPKGADAEVCQQAVEPALRNMLVGKDDVPLKTPLVETEGPGSQICSFPPVLGGQRSCLQLLSLQERL